MGLLLTMATIVSAMQAAQATVAGTVQDEETGEPLAGAVVALPDLNRAAATDAGGLRFLASLEITQHQRPGTDWTLAVRIRNRGVAYLRVVA